MKFTRRQRSSSLILVLKAGIFGPAPSRSDLNICPGSVPLFQNFGSVRSVAFSATMSRSALPSDPWQAAQLFKRYTVFPAAMESLLNDTGFLSAAASAAVRGAAGV